MGALARPATGWRNTVIPQLRRMLAMSTVFSVALGGWWWYSTIKPRHEAYRKFYDNLDCEEKFQRMRSKGVFQSCPPDEE